MLLYTAATGFQHSPVSRSTVRRSTRSNSFPCVPAGEAAATGASHTVAVRGPSAAVPQTSRSNVERQRPPDFLESSRRVPLQLVFSGSVIRSNVRISTRSNSFLFVPFGEVDPPAAVWADRQRRPTMNRIGRAKLPLCPNICSDGTVAVGVAIHLVSPRGAIRSAAL